MNTENTQNIIFKNATINDIEQLNHLLQLAKRNMAWYQSQPESAIKRYMNKYQFTTETFEHSIIIKALENEKMVGFFSLALKPGRTPLLDKFYLHPAYLYKGYGTILWDQLLMIAHQNNLPSFHIISTNDAIAFYTKKGAYPIGNERITEERTLSKLQYNVKQKN